MVKISSIRWMPVRTTLWGRGVLLFTLLALGSCSTNPAAPPAPPAELPSFLTLPDPTISVAEISHQASPDLSALVGSGPLAAEISVAPDLIQETNDALLALISNLNAQFQIPVSALTKTFEAPVSIGSGDTARTVDGKIDFADFDFDGDGSKEGCSGSTAPLPNGDVRICMRLWLDGHKVLAGLFKQYPAPGAPGAGRITVFSNPSLGEAEAGASFAFKYDFLDLTNRKTEFFSGITDNADPTTFVALRHTLVSQVGTEGSAQK